MFALCQSSRILLPKVVENVSGRFPNENESYLASRLTTGLPLAKKLSIIESVKAQE